MQAILIKHLRAQPSPGFFAGLLGVPVAPLRRHTRQRCLTPSPSPDQSCCAAHFAWQGLHYCSGTVVCGIVLTLRRYVGVGEYGPQMAWETPQVAGTVRLLPRVARGAFIFFLLHICNSRKENISEASPAVLPSPTAAVTIDGAYAAGDCGPDAVSEELHRLRGVRVSSTQARFLDINAFLVSENSPTDQICPSSLKHTVKNEPELLSAPLILDRSGRRLSPQSSRNPGHTSTSSPLPWRLGCATGPTLGHRRFACPRKSWLASRRATPRPCGPLRWPSRGRGPTAPS